MMTDYSLPNHKFPLGSHVDSFDGRTLERNMARKWPDWRTVPLGKAIEHIRDPEHEDPREYQP